MIMRVVVGLLILGAIWSAVNCKRVKTTSVQFNRITSTFNTRTVEFFDFFITPNSGGQSVEMKSRLLVNATQELHVAINVLMWDKAKNDYKRIVWYDFDLCRLSEGAVRQTIAKLCSKNRRKYNNLPMRCPVMAGNYFVKNLQLNAATVPMFITSGAYIINLMIYMKTGPVEEWLTKSSMEVFIARD